ncbi:MAG TPA: YdcF family protein [Clostridia bacterium]|nr:YdcF family protein [Clostridia bacterium]
MFRALLVLTGSLLVLDTVIIKSLTTGNLGTYLPSILGLPLLLLGLFFVPVSAWFEATRIGVFFKWFLICAYSLAILFFAVISSVLYKEGHEKPPANADVVIVLGAGLRGSRVSLTLQYRLDAAYEYLKQNPNTILVLSGGQGEGETVSEAIAMKSYLLSRGVSADKLIIEDRSKSTYENFKYSLALLKKQFGTDMNIAFITTEFHVYRAELVAKRMGIDASGIGAKGVWYISPNDYMRESIALTVYWLRGNV